MWINRFVKGYQVIEFNEIIMNDRRGHIVGIRISRCFKVGMS